MYSERILKHMYSDRILKHMYSDRILKHMYSDRILKHMYSDLFKLKWIVTWRCSNLQEMTHPALLRWSGRVLLRLVVRDERTDEDDSAVEVSVPFLDGTGLLLWLERGRCWCDRDDPEEVLSLDLQLEEGRWLKLEVLSLDLQLEEGGWLKLEDSASQTNKDMALLFNVLSLSEWCFKCGKCGCWWRLEAGTEKSCSKDWVGSKTCSSQLNKISGWIWVK